MVTSSILTYPFDTVRRRLMIQSGKQEKNFRGSLDCWRKISKTEGINGFFRGCMTNSLRTASGAFVLAIYYEVIKYI